MKKSLLLAAFITLVLMVMPVRAESLANFLNYKNYGTYLFNRGDTINASIVIRNNGNDRFLDSHEELIFNIDVNSFNIVSGCNRWVNEGQVPEDSPVTVPCTLTLKNSVPENFSGQIDATYNTREYDIDFPNSIGTGTTPVFIRIRLGAAASVTPTANPTVTNTATPRITQSTVTATPTSSVVATTVVVTTPPASGVIEDNTDNTVLVKTVTDYDYVTPVINALLLCCVFLLILGGIGILLVVSKKRKQKPSHPETTIPDSQKPEGQAAS